MQILITIADPETELDLSGKLKLKNHNIVEGDGFLWINGQRVEYEAAYQFATSLIWLVMKGKKGKEDNDQHIT